MSNKYVKLLQPALLDFSTLQNDDKVKIEIRNMKHKFATDAEYSGTEVIKHPIFGSRVFINGKKVSKLSFGFPFIRFPQGSKPKIKYENKTNFTFNIHYHGLNTVGSVDGTAMEVVFGKSTLLGPKVTFQFPEITNNQGLLWFHSHNMFVSMELIYAGLVGLLQIVDKPTQWLTDRFEYGNNQILLAILDMDLTNTGTQTFANLVKFGTRSTFTVVNGTSAVNWYSDQPVPFVNPLFHTVSKNLVKIDILNASLNFRVFHIGVCDENLEIKTFYLVQTDSGLMNPTELKMAFVSTASRIGIIIDLNQFKHKVAHLFFYNYDLTEILESTPAFPDQPTNPTLVGTVQDLQKSNNPTPNPTPIPDPNQQNPQHDYSRLNYPVLNLIPQTEQVLNNGTIQVPQYSSIKPFLKIFFEKKSNHANKENKLSLTKTISQIRKTIFGYKIYKELKSFIKQPSFEYNQTFNYLTLLNPNYFYNVPDVSADVPWRNLFMFTESDTNAIAGGNPDGTTEYTTGSNRIMVDLWNSSELNLEWALQLYGQAPNNYKPPILPTSKFRIYKTNDEFSNTSMISNDTLIIQIFTSEIAYGNFSQASRFFISARKPSRRSARAMP